MPRQILATVGWREEPELHRAWRWKFQESEASGRPEGVEAEGKVLPSPIYKNSRECKLICSDPGSIPSQYINQSTKTL